MRSLKRSIPLLLILLLALSAGACAVQTAESPTPSPAEAEPFTDIPADADYAQAAAWCRTQGLMQGTSPTTFGPDATLTRSMVATVLHRAAGEPAAPDGAPFTDVPAGQWYSEAILWASDRGIVKGYGGGLFGPNDPVTLEQLEVMIGRYEGRDPAWKGDPALAVPATRAQAAAAFYAALSQQSTPSPAPVPEVTVAPEAEAGGRILVAYFSNTSNTANIASHIQASLGDRADLWQIVPEDPYTAADLNYNTDCRANREQDDPAARPAISGQVENMEQYDVVFLGYPIWWGRAPRIIYTFLESYDWAGKTVIPFCTSGSSPYNDSGIRELVGDDTDWRTGRRLAGGTDRSTVAQWVDSLELPEAEKEESTMYIQIGQTLWTAALADNPSVEDWKELLSQRPLTVDMHDYGGFEKVGDIGTTLTRSDTPTDTQPGDIILYQGTSVVIYYGTNSWNFTPLGRVENVTREELREALKAGGENVSVTFSLEKP